MVIGNFATADKVTWDWDPQRLRVTFTPSRVSAEHGGDVSAGRVSLFYA